MIRMNDTRRTVIKEINNNNNNNNNNINNNNIDQQVE